MESGIAGGDETRKSALTAHFSGARGKVIKALLMADRRMPQMDDEIRAFLAQQDEKGAWPLTPSAKAAWGLSGRPAQGIKMGQMDGANTYLTALSIMAYRDAVYPTP
jgi:hypothetical protein